MSRAGYYNHMLGKWHLGFFEPSYTPTYRGFDSFFGFYNDEEDYFLHNDTASLINAKGFDLRRNLKPFLTEEYSTYMYAREARSIMSDYVPGGEKSDESFFLYWASQAAHIPWEAPIEKEEEFMYVKNSVRRALAAVVGTLDDVIGSTVEWLQSEQSGYLWDDTLLIVSTDNGGDCTKGASNWPLRGSKRSLWEGGIKSTGIVTGGWLPDERRGELMGALMHATDWLPTLCHVAGIEPTYPSRLDGYSQLTNIAIGVDDKYFPRELLIHNVFSVDCSQPYCG